MNYFKNVFIATVLLNLAMILASDYSAYTQEAPVNLEEQVNIPETTPATEETPQEPTQPLTDTEETQPAIASATAGWNNHLTALKEGDDNWDSANNLPTNSWKETAITLAKTLLDKDKALAESLKTEFLNTVSTAIEQKNGTLSAAYTFVQSFDNTIDAYLKTLTEPEIKEEPKPVEEVKQEPVTETPAPAPVEEVPAPTPPAEEQKVTPTETAPTTETPQDIIQQWNSILESITKEGTTLEGNRTLLQKAYPIARELFVQKPASAETIQSNLENALNEHNQNLLLEPINIKQAMIAFSEATGIALAKEEMEKQNQERKTDQKSLGEKQKEAALKLAMLERIEEQAPASKSSEIADLTARLKQKLINMETESDQKVASLKQELATLRKAKEKTPETPTGGIFGTLKNIASSASQWWYGDTESIAAFDKERREKLQELLAAMPLTDNQKLFIEEKWNTFISNLRSFKDLDTDDAIATKQWLIEIEQALEYITITHHIISIKDAIDITKDAIKEQPEGTKFINEIKKYLEEKRYKIIQEKEQKENEHVRILQKKQEEKEAKIRKQQQLKEEKRLKKAEKHALVSQQEKYLHEIYDWHQFLKNIADNKQATNQDNNKYTHEAIKKAHVLINQAALLSPEEKNIREQAVKHEFSNALLEQQRNNDITANAINIHKNMDHFNAAM